MKNIFLIVFCLLVSTVWAKEEKNKRIQYCTTLEEAMQQAARKHKPIFFNCYAGWAGPSVLMDSVVLTDPDLVSFIQKHFVSLRVDMPKTQEGRKLAERYRVKFYAHYLILDEKGEIIHRISGGAKAPEFKEKLKAGLNPKTSLAGMTRHYEKGDRSFKFLAAYAGTLKTADENEKFQEVADYYLEHIDSAGLYLPQSWEILWYKGKRYDSEWFRFIYDHRNELVEKNGEKVLNFIVQVLFHQVYPYMMFEKVYDMDFISEIEQKAGHLEFTSLNRDQLLDMCKILHFRQQKKYSEMLDLWGKMVPNLPNEALKVRYDATLGRLQDMNETEKKQAIAYLKERMAGMTGSTLERYRQIVTELSDYQGIRFETGGLQEALAKARKENKAVFVDCYTSWCGPCKMMSSKVFPDKQAGDFFNPRFISLKIDMEKDEGKELAQKWNIRVFPTYLILDPQGEIVYTSQGYIPAEELIRRMNEGLEQWKNNIKTGK